MKSSSIYIFKYSCHFYLKDGHENKVTNEIIFFVKHVLWNC